MNKAPKFLIFLLPVIFAFTSPLHATHIVGGELNYTCLGNNRYEIELVVYRDCENGAPLAYFDDPAYIGVYNDQGELVDELAMPWFGVDDTLSPMLSGDCFVDPPNVCVHTTYYLDTLELQPIPGGYTLLYQRCCRNGTINNIIEPLATGATFSINISEKAMLECNSNAQFVNWPPIYICVNEPIFFDHSAIDPDGDSIIYKLCTPLNGANQTDPYPIPANQTVPMPVNWNPPFNEENMLGGVPLQIDLHTGLMTGVPNLTGQFVVGVCVEEYRNGELISITRRDFQYNVGICGVIEASFAAPSVQCDSLTVGFSSLSQDVEEFIWFFDWLNDPSATSMEENPQYTYPDTGIYQVAFVVEPGSICVDTAYAEVSLQYTTLEMNFEVEMEGCSDTVFIQATDFSSDLVFEIAQRDWTLSANGLIVATSTEVNPTFAATFSGIYFLTLEATSTNGCTKTLVQPLQVNLIDDIGSFSDTLITCKGVPISLNSSPNLNYDYQWSPDLWLDDASKPNPESIPDSSIAYSVTVVSLEDSLCSRTFTTWVTVPEPVTADAMPDSVTCASLMEVYVETNLGNQFLWAVDREFENLVSVTQTFSYVPLGTRIFYVQVRDEFGCLAIDSVTIVGQGVNIISEDEKLICEGDSIEIAVVNIDAFDQLTYEWSPAGFILEGENTSSPLVRPPGPGSYTFYVNIENQYGCTLLDSIIVGVIDSTPQLDFVAGQQCSGFTVQFLNSSANAPFYIWDFGDPTNPNDNSTDENPSYTYPDTGTYLVTLTIDGDLPCKDTIIKEIQVVDPQIFVEFSYVFEECSDTAVIKFIDLSSNLQSNIDSWHWKFGDLDSSNLKNPTLTIYESQTLEVTLTVTSSDGCSDEITKTIVLDLIEVNLSDTILACRGNPTSLLPGANPTYIYSWMPETGLDNPSSPNPRATLFEDQLYTVTVSKVMGFDTCRIMRSVFAEVSLPLELEVSPDTSVCSETFEVWASSPQAVQYYWAFDSGLQDIFSFDSSTVVSAIGTNTFFVGVEDQFGCIKVDSVTVEGHGVFITGDREVKKCAGDTFNIFLLNIVQGDELTFDWFPKEFIVEGADKFNPLVSVAKSTQFTVQVTNQYGCEVWDTVKVVVQDLGVVLEAFADPDTVFAGETVQLEATFDPDFSYSWSPAEFLDDPFIWNPIAHPTENTVFSVRITDQNGCSGVAEVRVAVVSPLCEEPFVFFPNAFTPNGDGRNDVLRIRGTGIDEVYFVIYNRWGNKVFESFSKEDGWDGTYKGEELSSDVFGYFLRVRCLNGEIFQRKGNISLLK